MKWIAIDIGNNEIKAAVRGIGNRPTKLLYDDCGKQFSFMPSTFYCINGNPVYVGNYISVMGALRPENLFKLNSLSNKGVLLKVILKIIKDAAVHYYDDKSIGAVLLYEDLEDETLYELAKPFFTEVQCKCASEVLPSVLFKGKGRTLVIDISMSALKISLVENGKKTAYDISNEMGFHSVDISNVIGYVLEEDSSEIEMFLHGQLIDKVRADLCQGCFDSSSLDALSTNQNDGERIIKLFEDRMVKYLFGCFDVCTQNLKKLSLNWNDVNNIILCGGASNYYKMSETFNGYLKGCGLDADTYNIETYTKDAQWAAVYSALRLHLTEEDFSFKMEPFNL